MLFGRNPENVFVYGKAGFGKTAVTKYMLMELHEEVRTREAADELHTHTVNCNGRTLSMVVRSLVNELIPDHASRFPERGLGTGDAFGEPYRQLDRIGGAHLIVFNEIDHLEDTNTLLYELPRAKANGHISDSKLGVICISNDYTFQRTLSPKVKDTLRLKSRSVRMTPGKCERSWSIARTGRSSTERVHVGDREGGGAGRTGHGERAAGARSASRRRGAGRTERRDVGYQ